MFKVMVLVIVMVAGVGSVARAEFTCVETPRPFDCVDIWTYEAATLADGNSWWNGERLLYSVEPTLERIEMGQEEMVLSWLECDDRCEAHAGDLAVALRDTLAERIDTCDSALSECLGGECPACPACPALACADIPACPVVECPELSVDLSVCEEALGECMVLGRSAAFSGGATMGGVMDDLNELCSVVKHKSSGGWLKVRCREK